MPTRARTTSAKTDGAARFEGFADAGCTFFKQLAKNQDRDWFAKHKAEFQEGWERPMLSLLREAKTKLDGAYPDCDIAEPKVFRIHRDVRFSADKSPYKTHIGGALYVKIGQKGMTEVPAPLYVQLGTESFSGAGHYMMDAAQLAKFRASVVDEEKGGELAKIVAKLEKAGFVMGSHDELKKVPRGFDAEHPRASLLKKKGLVVTFPKLSSPKVIAERKFLDEVVTHAKAVAPLVRWLTFHAST